MTRVSALAVVLLVVALAGCGSGSKPPRTTPTSGPAPTAMRAPPSAPSPGPATAAPTPFPVPVVAAGVISGLRAESGDTVVTLIWQADPAAAGYFVYRDGNETPLINEPVREPRYQDIGLTNGRTYTYTVAIAGASGQPGPLSPPVTAKPTSSK